MNVLFFFARVCVEMHYFISNFLPDSRGLFHYNVSEVNMFLMVQTADEFDKSSRKAAPSLLDELHFHLRALFHGFELVTWRKKKETFRSLRDFSNKTLARVNYQLHIKFILYNKKVAIRRRRKQRAEKCRMKTR